MPELAVPSEEQPSALKYAALTLTGFLLVAGIVATVQQWDSPGLTIVATLVGAIVNLGILFVMIQSLIEEWFNAVEITDG